MSSLINYIPKRNEEKSKQISVGGKLEAFLLAGLHLKLQNVQLYLTSFMESKMTG